MTENYFEALAAVDCSTHVEKKGKFTYLSWPFAIAELAKRHPDAEIDVAEFANGIPAVQTPKGWMVKVSVTVKGIKRTQWHPVLDNSNKPIVAPDVFQINTSIQRATVKAIALHGLGLYIYAGEDIPGAATTVAGDEQESTGDVGRPTDGAWEALDDAERNYLESIAVDIMKLGKNFTAGYDLIESENLSAEHKIALWTRLDSATRSGLKKAATAAKESA